MNGIVPSAGGGGELQRFDGNGRAQASPGGPRQDPDTIDLRDVLRVLRRHYVLVLACTLLALAGALALVLREQPQYRASATIRLKDERQALTGSIEAPGLDQMLGKTVDPLLSQLEVMRSRSVAMEVVRRTGTRLVPLDGALPYGTLAHVSVVADAPADTLELRFEDAGFTVKSREGSAQGLYGQPFATSRLSFTIAARPEVGGAHVALLDEQDAIEHVQEHLRAVPLEKTDVVQVSFTDPDRELARAVVNAAVAVFQEANANEAQQLSRRRRMFIQEQLGKTDSVLADAQSALSEFRRREEVFSSREKFAAQQTGMLDLEMRREELSAERSVHARLLNALRATSNGNNRALRALVSAPNVADNPVIASLYQQLVRYQAARDSLTTGGWAAAGTNPDVQRLDALIATAREGLIDAAAGQLTAIDARLASLGELQQRHAAGLQAQPDKEAEEMRLVQRVETARRLADQLREEYQKAQIAEAIEVGQVDIIDTAPLPTRPIGSGKPLKLALALMLGLMVGSGAAFLREHLDTHITRKDELEPLLGLPALAVIPRIAPANGKPRTPLGRHLKGGKGSGTHVDRPMQDLVTVSEGRSSGAEAYRSLRTNLLFSRAAQSLQALVVTSPMAAEGKTTTAANLAVAFAQQGLRVVLVDVDLRKARLHHVFGMAREPGIVDVIMGSLTLADALRPTGVEGLSVLTAGTLPPNPAELLGNERMRAVLDDLQRAADLVIMDAPPVLVAGDASILCAMADGTVLVVRAGKTEREAARAAVQQLRSVGAAVIGSVLNDPDAKVPAYESHYYYAYSYYGDHS